MSDLGFCAPCAASVIPTPVLGDWKSELGSWLLATALICGFAGWKAGNMYCSSVFLKREASLRKKRRKRKRRK
jgi:hypothetical protein